MMRGDIIKRLEIANILIVIVTLILGIGSDTFLASRIPEFLIMKDIDSHEMAKVLFQVHATVSTLGIALISILSGSNNDVCYGISVSRYILQVRPRVLKHMNIIVVLMICVFLNYILLSYDLYNSIVATLFVAIILILHMLSEISTVFNGREMIKEEIGCYLKRKSNNLNILGLLMKDTLNGIDRREEIKYMENIELLLSIFEEKAEFIESKADHKAYWEECFADHFYRLLGKSSEVNLHEVYSYLESVYEIVIKRFAKPYTFILWDRINHDFFDSLRRFQVNDVDDFHIFASIRGKLYSTLHYSVVEDKVQRNNHYLEHIYPRVYSLILKDNTKVVNVSNSTIERRMRSYFEDIMTDLEYGEKIDGNKDVAFNELKLYSKSLIDSSEISVLKKTLIKKINYYSEYYRSEGFRRFFMVIFIYIYYLSEKESLIDDKLKNSTKQFLSLYISEISNFFHEISWEMSIKTEDVEYIRKSLGWWEYIPEEEAKFTIMDSCINSFLLFTFLHCVKRAETFKKSLEAVIANDVFSFIHTFTGDKKGNIAEEYKQFVNTMFLYEITDAEIEDDLDRLENVLFEIYKVYELKEGENKSLSDSKIQYLEGQIKEKFENVIRDDFSIFESTESDFGEGCFELNVSTYSYFIESGIERDIKLVHMRFVQHFLWLLIDKHQIKYKELSFRDKTILNDFFDLASNSGLNLDTIIGYRDWFYGYDKESEFKAFEDSVKKIKDERITDIVATLDSEKIRMKIFDFDVKIEDIDIEREMSELELDNDGKYLYNITNDIYLPFDKAELINLLKYTRKKVKFTCKYHVHFSDIQSGVAIISKKVKTDA